MKKTRQKQRGIGKRVAVCMLALLLVGLLGACKKTEDNSSEVVSTERTVFVEGTILDGENISGKTAQEAIDLVKSKMQKHLDSLEITVRFQDDTIVLSGTDFDHKEMFELTIPKILASGQAGSYDISYVTDLSEQGKQKVMDAASICYKAPEDAKVTGYDSESDSFSFADEVVGQRVDTSKTLENIRQLLAQNHGGDLQAEFITVKPELMAADMADRFVKIASYSTESTNTENGNHNMDLALQRINGTILEPGQEFSYNTVVGDSTTLDTGFLYAGGLSGGVSVQMVGGGICQASTTLYGAVIRSGLEITMRECHSMPSSYCPIGQDATVDYGNLDFCFRNNMEMPIYIQSWMSGVTLYVNIYGVQPEAWDYIDVSSYETGSYSPLSEVSYVYDGSLGSGEYVIKSYGNTGYEAVASRTFYKDEQVVKTEDLPSSYYRPTGRVYAYGPDTDTTKIDGSKESGNTNKGKATPSPKPGGASGNEDNGSSTSSTPTPDPVDPEPDPDSEPEYSEPESESVSEWENDGGSDDGIVG